MNPYTGSHFFSFFATLFSRLFLFLTGQGGDLKLASDEVQLLVLGALSMGCALMGSLLVVRKMTMFANALSHTSLFGIALAYIFLWKFPMVILSALFSGLLTAFLVEFLQKTLKMRRDVSIGLVFTTLFALGIFLISLTAKNVHIGTELVMGNIDALQKSDISLALLVLGLNISFILLFFKELQVTSFDPLFSKSVGISPTLFHYLLTMLSAVVTICAFRAVGVLMVLAFLTGPTLVARFFTSSLKRLLGVSMLISLLVSLVGVALSRHLFTYLQVGLSTAGLTVTLLFFTYILCYFLKPLHLNLRSR